VKKIDLGQCFYILGNVGVIVGILLLAYELHQNGDMMRAQTRSEISQGAINLLALSVNDGSFQSILRRGRSGEELSEDEQFQFQRYYNAWFRYWENMHYQYRIGLYDEAEFAAHRKVLEASFSRLAVVTPWCQTESLYSPEFAAFIDDLLTAYQCEQLQRTP